MAERKLYTPWHPLFAALMQAAYRHRCTVHAEYPLTQWPLRADVLLIERDKDPGPLQRLPVIAAHLGRRYTLLELKGPTDELERLDLPMLLSYGGLLEVQEQVADPREIHLMILASSFPPAFHARVAEGGGHFIPKDRGLYLVDGLGYTLSCIETAAASELPGNGLLYAFSREHLRDPRRLRSRLSTTDRDFYGELCQYIQQMKQSERTMAMKDADLFTQSSYEIMRSVLSMMSPEERLRALGELSPEERLRALGELSPEERLRGLPAEERVADLSPEEQDQLAAFLNRLREGRSRR